MASIKDIAEATGVSASTVSRVINGKSYVNEETRRKVMAMIEQINYQPNRLAQSLKMGRTNAICLVMPSIENMIFPPITKGVEDFARKNGYTVLLCNTDEDEQMEQDYIENVKQRMISGFLICTALNDSRTGKALRDEGFPVVLLNRYTADDLGNVDTVSTDNYQAAYSGTKYLIRTGHRRIALALGRNSLFLYRERYRGYCQALADEGIPYDENLVMKETVTQNGQCFYEMSQELMKSPEPPDAFFATSDQKAFVIIHALHNLGIRIPEEVSVLGFDNVYLSSMVEPPLSTLSQPLYDMGVYAAGNLLHQIEYKEKNGVLPKPVNRYMNAELVIRRSTDLKNK